MKFQTVWDIAHNARKGGSTMQLRVTLANDEIQDALLRYLREKFGNPSIIIVEEPDGLPDSLDIAIDGLKAPMATPK
jgi:hypothetical protein